MILRRISEHVRAQNWFAVGIDFVIVVVGVFIGIQVANWNEERIERELIGGHLSEIADDLRSHLALEPGLKSSARLRIAAVDYIHREAFATDLPPSLILATARWQAPPADPLPSEVVDNLMGAVNLVRISVGSRNGYEALTSSGRLALLRNRRLARQIQTYYGGFDDLLDTTAMFRTFRNDGAGQQYALGVSVFDQRPAAEIVMLARDNPGFAAYLRSQREWAIIHYSLLKDVGEETRLLLSAIENELARP